MAPRQTKTEEASTPEVKAGRGAVIAPGETLCLDVKVLRISGAWVHLDVAGSLVVLLHSRLRTALALDG